MHIRLKNATMMSLGVLLAGTLAWSTVWADPDRGYGHGDSSRKEGYGHGGHGSGMMGGLHHGSTTHFLRHLLKHEKDIGLREEQVSKLKDLQLNLDKTRIKTEADIMVLQREVKALVEDEKSDLSAIESKLKQSEELEVALRMAAIKTRRDALSVLTPEQREKQDVIHEKMMQEHRMMRSGHGESSTGRTAEPRH